MKQKNPLLLFKNRSVENEEDFFSAINYNLESGLWETRNNEPLIKTIYESGEIRTTGVTVITATREGIDRSEGTR